MAQDARLERAAVLELALDGVALVAECDRDDVPVGDDEARVVEDDAGALALGHVARGRARTCQRDFVVDVDAHDRIRGLLHGAHDRCHAQVAVLFVGFDDLEPWLALLQAFLGRCCGEQEGERGNGGDERGPAL